MDYTLRFRITEDGKLNVRSLSSYEDISFNDDDDESEDLAVYEDDNGESIVRDPKDDTNETLVNTMNDDTKDEFEILKILKERLKKNTTIRLDSCSSEDKCTALHKAAKMGYTKIVEWLLKKHANPNTENKFHKTPLEVAIQEKHDETAEILVKKMSRESVVNHFWKKTTSIIKQTRSQDNSGDNKEIKLSIKSLLENKLMKTTLAVLDHFKDRCHNIYLVGPLEMDDAKKIPTDENYNVKHMTAYQLIALENNLESFASHECVKALTESKFRAYGNSLLWRTALVYFFFLGLLTFAAVTGVMADDAAKCDTTIDVLRVISELLVCLYAVFTLVGECIQIIFHITDYVKDLTNFVDLGHSVLILCVIPLRFTNHNEQWHVFAFGYILWVFQIFKIAKLNPVIGHLGHIILVLFLDDVWKFVIYFMIILLSFSGGLLLSLKGDDNLAVHEESSNFHGILFLGVRVLIEGQPFLDYTGPNGYSPVSCIVMMGFLFFTCVVMINIFIAMLSNRFHVIQQNATVFFHHNAAKTMAKLELKDDLTIFRCGEPLWKKHYKDEINMGDLNKEHWFTTLIDGFCSGIGLNGLIHLCKRKCCCNRVSPKNRAV